MLCAWYLVRNRVMNRQRCNGMSTFFCSTKGSGIAVSGSSPLSAFSNYCAYRNIQFELWHGPLSKAALHSVMDWYGLHYVQLSYPSTTELKKNKPSDFWALREWSKTFLGIVSIKVQPLLFLSSFREGLISRVFPNKLFFFLNYYTFFFFF